MNALEKLFKEKVFLADGYYFIDNGKFDVKQAESIKLEDVRTVLLEEAEFWKGQRGDVEHDMKRMEESDYDSNIDEYKIKEGYAKACKVIESRIRRSCGE